MSKQIRRSLEECISKVKIINKQIRFPACRHIRAASFAVEAVENDPTAATLADIDRFLFENFRSLYQKEYEEEINESKPTTYLFDSPRILKSPPPENLCASDRFFVASGSSSSRIVEEACSCGTNKSRTAAEAEEKHSDSPDDFLVLLKQSRRPYEDFRRSMEEMVEAHLEHSGKVDWEYLEELLRCFLELNNKNSHKHVVQAFVDLVENLRENSRRNPAIRRRRNGGAPIRKLN